MPDEFDPLVYTRESLAEELGLIERHATDGSAFKAGCSCIQEKHLLMVSGLTREGVTLASVEKEKEFYGKLGDAARELRKTIVDHEFQWPSNPLGPRKYQPHGLTEEEKDDPELLKLRSKCIHDVEKSACPSDFQGDYSLCSANPVAVCRASVKS